MRTVYRPRSTIDGEQLELSALVYDDVEPRAPRARDNLRAVFARCNWSQHDFARLVLGCHERTLQRYLAGGKIPEDRANWIRQLEAVAIHGDRVLITVRTGPPIRWPSARRRQRS